MKVAALAVWASVAVSAQAAEPGLKPVMVQPEKVTLKDDFSSVKTLAKGGAYAALQGTRWVIADGVLRGQPSSPEYQASKKDHKGLEPRVAISAPAGDFMAEFSVRFIGGQPTGIVPFIEFGHHCGRITWAGGGGAKLVADGESVQLAEAKEFKIESGKWYHVLAEVKGDELVVQFEGGPTLYGKHASLAAEKTKPAVGVTGGVGGTVEIDNVTIWSIKPEAQKGWAEAREKLPKPTAVVWKDTAKKK